MPKKLNFKEDTIEIVNLEQSDMSMYTLEINLTDKCNFKCTYCITGDSDIIMSDFSTKKIKDIIVGDKILGFDEYKEKYKHRKVYPSKVLKLFQREEEVIKITLENNKSINITKNHKIYNNRSNYNNGLKEAGKYKINQNIIGLWYNTSKSCNINDDYKIGYLLGIILGDGTLKKYKENHHGPYYDIFAFRLALKDKEPIERTKKYLSNFNIDFVLRDFKISEKYNIMTEAIFSGKRETFKNLKNLIKNNFRKNKTYEYLCGFLSGIFDAEGSHQKNSIRIFNTNNNILNEIKDGLLKLKIEFKKENNGCPCIRFCNSFDRIKFIQIVNPSIKRKGFDVIYNSKLLNSQKIKKIDNLGIKKVYNIETESGTYIANNFAVHNCFEGDHNKIRENWLEKNVDILIEKIYSILDNKWFKLTFKGLKIDFWGGEPTLNIPLMKKIIDEFKDNERVKFFIYTNGSRIDKILPILKELNTKKVSHNDRKIKVQVSYDGMPVHDMCRVDRANNPTSTIVKNSFKLLHNENILFNLKSTITPENIKYMPDVWDDFKNLYYRYGDEINYAPTLDYYKVYDNEKYFKYLETSLIDIAKKEIIFYKENKRFLFSWFSKNKIDCGVGRGMSCVDVDGKVYYCHGGVSLDTTNKHFCFSNINDKNFIDNIKDNYYKFKSEVIIDECQMCEATICLRCNVVKYINSQKEDFFDRFYDYTSQPILCKYYKLIGKIHRALALVIKEDKIN